MEKFIEKETEKAYLVNVKVENVILDKEKIIKVWIPKSAITIKGHEIRIASWIIQKNIISQDGDTFKGFVIA